MLLGTGEDLGLRARQLRGRLGSASSGVLSNRPNR